MRANRAHYIPFIPYTHTHAKNRCVLQRLTNVAEQIACNCDRLASALRPFVAYCSLVYRATMCRTTPFAGGGQLEKCFLVFTGHFPRATFRSLALSMLSKFIQPHLEFVNNFVVQSVVVEVAVVGLFTHTLHVFCETPAGGFIYQTYAAHHMPHTIFVFYCRQPLQQPVAYSCIVVQHSVHKSATGAGAHLPPIIAHRKGPSSLDAFCFVCMLGSRCEGAHNASQWAKRWETWHAPSYN